MGKTGIWIVALATLGLIFFRVADAIELTEKQEALMEKGKAKELAKSLTRGSAGRIDRVCTLFLFVRDNIATVQTLKTRSAPGQVLRNAGARSDDKARLLAEMLKKAGEESYLARMYIVQYGEQFTDGFVAIKTKKGEASKFSRFTGGGGTKYIKFPRKKKDKPVYIPLYPVAGHSVGQLSKNLYEETKDGGWKEWKSPPSFSKYSAQK